MPFFTFIGIANSGKRYMCELLLQADAQLQNMKTFDMDKYSGNVSIAMEQFSVASLESEVTEFVAQNPNAILVFEDIEKADLQMQLSLYSLFEETQKSEIDFSNIIVVCTTTRLASLLQRQDLRELLKNDPMQAHTFLIQRLSREVVILNGVKEEAFDKKLLSLL